MLAPLTPVRRVFAFLAVLALGLPAAALAQDGVGQAEPASGRIVYSRAEKNVFDLWTSDPDGSNEVQLSDIDESPAGEDYPRWSPDGTQVVFETTSNSSPPRITLWTVPAVGGEPTLLAKDVGVRGGTPDWSPDGRCLTFSGAPSPGNMDSSDIWISCEGEEPRRLTDTPGINEQEAVWHPDGTRLAFVARTADLEDTTSCWQLFEYVFDGEQVLPLLELPENQCSRFPRWSRDGSRLGLIITNHIGFDFGTLYVLEPGSGALTALVSKPSGPFAWAPDDSALLFNNIALSGVSVQPSDDLAAPNGSTGALPGATDAQVQRTTRALQDFGIGLYRLEIDGRRLTRLRDKAGGNTCTSERCFEFGYAPDWTPGTYTPTPPATPTPLATSTPTPTLTPVATNTPIATATSEATPTAEPPDPIYLPRLFRNDPDPDASPAPTEEPTEALPHG